MITDQQWLWVGVAISIGGGLYFVYCFWWYARGRYFVEMHSEGAEKGFWEALRWIFATAWAAGAILSFFIAYWLVKYILTQPI